MSPENLRARFRENVACVLDKTNIDAISGKVARLEREAAIAALMDLCVRKSERQRDAPAEYKQKGGEVPAFFCCAIAVSTAI
jgi:hypothetical protein